MTTLIKTVLDLHKVSAHGSGVTYKSDPESREVWVTIPKNDYDELGQPQQITVGVQPGDMTEKEYAAKEPTPEEPASKTNEPPLLTPKTEEDEEADAPFGTSGDE